MTPRERTDQQCQRLAAQHAWRQTHPPVPWEHHPNRRVFTVRFDDGAQTAYNQENC